MKGRGGIKDIFWCEEEAGGGVLGGAGGAESGRGGLRGVGGDVRIPRRLRGRVAGAEPQPGRGGEGGSGCSAETLADFGAHPSPPPPPSPAHLTGCDLIPRRGNNFLINVRGLGAARSGGAGAAGGRGPLCQ